MGMNDMSMDAIERLPLTLTVPETAQMLRIGRNSCYNLVRCGAIRSLRVGRRLRIPRDAVAEFLNSTR